MTSSLKSVGSKTFAASPTVEPITPADFTTDEGALAYANALLDRMIEGMRYKLERHIIGWPGDDRELDTLEAFRHLLRDINYGHSAYFEADYENPAFAKLSATSRINFQSPCADCLYHSVPLHSDYQYRITGDRGSAALFQLGLYNGHGCDAIGWKTHTLLNNFDHPEDLAPGRHINVVLSRNKPDDLGDALWMELPEGRSELISRQYYGNWETEAPANLMIRNEKQTFPADILTRETAELRLKRLTDLLHVQTNYCRASVEAHLQHDPGEIDELLIPGAFDGVRYYPGHFRCQKDEAVIIEVRNPGAPYWNTALYNMQWETFDMWARSASFNYSQVHTDPDGKVRFVASWDDPGVPNWLDVSGRILSLVTFRFFRPQQNPDKPKLKTVKLADLRDHLPPGTPGVTPEERHEILQRRLYSVYRRRIGDF